MRYLLVFALAVVLAGCQYTPQTPLGHALAALRAGDRDAFLKAKAEADAALKTAWQPGQSSCLLNPYDFEIRGETLLIDKLDHADIFKLSDEARFVYAAHVLGKFNAPMNVAAKDGAFDTVLRTDFTSAAHMQECTQDQEAVQRTLQLSSAGPAQSETDRVGVMQEWQSEIRARYGDDNAFQDHLREANAALDRNGYSADYPLVLEFTDPDAGKPIGTFADVQKKVGN
jgi:hypothetical protein